MANVRSTRALRLALPIASLLAALAPSCTTFDGVTLQGDGGAESGDDAASCAPEDSPQALLPFADAARVCARVASCPLLSTSLALSNGVPVDPLTYSLCVHWLAAPVPPSRVGLPVQRQVLSCMAKATSCGDAAACLAFEALPAGDARCADAGATSHCVDSSTVARCDQSLVFHCGAATFGPGAQCIQGNDGQYVCGQTGCPPTACQGDLIDGCQYPAMRHVDTDCAAAGLNCGPDPSDPQQVTCLTEPGKVLACGAPGSTSCQGDKALVCVGGQLSEFDCSSLPGGTCTADGGGARCVVPRDDACSPYDADVDVCTGTTITLCVDGRHVCFDCASIGQQCVPGSGGATARCG